MTEPRIVHPTEGWWLPHLSQRWHYMVVGRSLCGKWGVLGPVPLLPHEGSAIDDCPACELARVDRFTATPLGTPVLDPLA